MASITKAVLTDRILRHLGVLASGETASGKDAAFVGDFVEAAYEEVNKIGTMEAGFTSNAIPDWAQEPMKDRVSFLVANSFGIPPERIAGVLAPASGVALSILVKHFAAPTGGTDVLLRNAIADTLGLTAPGETPSAAEAAIIDAGITAWFDFADEQGTVGYNSTTIPNWAETYLRDIVAERVAKPLGVTDPGILRMLAGQAVIGRLEVEKRFTALGESATKTILRNMILRRLGVIGVAEDPTAAQIEIAEEILDNAFSQLQTEKSVTFTTAAIPNWAMLNLRDYIAYYAAGAFGQQPSQFIQESRFALKELRAQVAKKRPLTEDPVKAKYY